MPNRGTIQTEGHPDDTSSPRLEWRPHYEAGVLVAWINDRTGWIEVVSVRIHGRKRPVKFQVRPITE